MATYEKKTWASEEIINRSELQNMEDGIFDAYTVINNIQAIIDALPDFETFMKILDYDADADKSVDLSEASLTLKTANDIYKTYSDIANEIDSDIATHSSNASAHHIRYTDEEAVAAINADTSHGTSATHNYRTDEEIRDVTAAMIVAGTGVAVTNNDTADTLTIALSDNAFTSAYKTKLDGIETGATADMTGTQIVSAINASGATINTNNLILPTDTFTEAYQEKLDGIEAGATADMNGSEIITAINASSAVINPANIDRGNLATVIEREFNGEVVVGDCIKIFIPAAATIQSINLISDTKPVDSSLIVDVRKNGYDSTNSVFSSDNPMTLSTSATVHNGIYYTSGTLDSGQISLSAYDVLRCYVLQTGSAVGVSVCIRLLF